HLCRVANIDRRAARLGAAFPCGRGRRLGAQVGDDELVDDFEARRGLRGVAPHPSRSQDDDLHGGVLARPRSPSTFGAPPFSNPPRQRRREHVAAISRRERTPYKAAMHTALRVLTVLLGIFFAFQGIGWLMD